MRADARKNYAHLLAVARAVVTEQGADASLRDIARRADVGLGTLYRHFPAREALLDALLRTRFDELTAQAARLLTSGAPDEALTSWLRDCVACASEYSGVVTLMVSALEDPESALHDSCVIMRAAGTRLLRRAQAEGRARADLDGTDLFALVGALGWVSDRPELTHRADHLVDVITGAIFRPPADG